MLKTRRELLKDQLRACVELEHYKAAAEAANDLRELDAVVAKQERGEAIVVASVSREEIRALEDWLLKQTSRMMNPGVAPLGEAVELAYLLRLGRLCGALLDAKEQPSRAGLY